MTLTLTSRLCYRDDLGVLPVLLVMHGFSDSADSYTAEQLITLANLGYFVVVPNMRGRAGYAGTPDCSGREIYDIYDALQHVRQYCALASDTRAIIWGGSGGGGNALAAACKFPDTWEMVVSHCGMSDYGRDATYGWYQQQAERHATLEAWVGGSPVAVPNAYYARSAVDAIAGNYTGGYLYLFHKSDDTAVKLDQSQRVGAAMLAAGRTNYAEDYKDTWQHGNPTDGSQLLWSAVQSAPWTIPASGSVTVIGYIVTKRFAVWLRANGSTVYGLDAAADLAYDTATDQYTVTPLTGAIDVTVTQGAKSGSATNISEATLITVT